MATKTSTNPAGLYDLVISQLQPGGSYGAGQIAELGRAETKAVSAGTQSMVSSGLANTTVAGGLSKKFQEEVGVPGRAKIEESRMSALIQAMLGKATYLQQKEQFDWQKQMQEKQLGLEIARLNAQVSAGSGTGVAKPASQGYSVPTRMTAPESIYGQVAPTLGGASPTSGGEYSRVGTMLSVNAPSSTVNAPSSTVQSVASQYTPSLLDLVPSLKPPTPMQSFAQTAMSWLD